MGLTGNATAIVVVSVVFPVIAAAFVGLRFQCRRLLNLGFGKDDYWIVVAWIISTALVVPSFVGVYSGGIGQHVDDVTPEQYRVAGKIGFVSQLMYLASVTPIKISIIYFYLRIFGTNKTFKWVSYGILLSVVLWFIAFFFATLFQSAPISQNWTGIGHIIRDDIMYYTAYGTELTTDIIIMFLPVPIIKNLHLDRGKKLRLMGIFWLGAFCIVSAAVRLYYVTQLKTPKGLADPTYEVTYILVWTAIEPCTSIICACLPVLGPLFLFRGRGTQGHSSSGPESGSRPWISQSLPSKAPSEASMELRYLHGNRSMGSEGREIPLD
ncbi:hypothetical protein B0J14DRAFT_330726 [Halenospora varia]|nr:hypothetical protein B0J14DRAFT_330726 [Halenospora varia]